MRLIRHTILPASIDGAVNAHLALKHLDHKCIRKRTLIPYPAVWHGNMCTNNCCVTSEKLLKITVSFCSCPWDDNVMKCEQQKLVALEGCPCLSYCAMNELEYRRPTLHVLSESDVKSSNTCQRKHRLEQERRTLFAITAKGKNCSQRVFFSTLKAEAYAECNVCLAAE